MGDEEHIDVPQHALPAADVARTLWKDTRVALGVAPPPTDDEDDDASLPASAASRVLGMRATEQPPPQNGRFAFVRELGRGGMGRVDEMFDAVLGRAVAQKTVLYGAGFEETTLLVSEAQTCAQLEHPSIVPVYDFGAAPGTGFPQYTMRLVRGKTLRSVLDSKEPDPTLGTVTQRLGVLRQVCLAVEYAHSRGVVHRDLKPDNIICGEFGEVYILDWGIATLVEGSDVVRTEHGAVQGGSPGYMAPEQVLSGEISKGTDVFALGAILFEIVTGERAFVDADVPSILRRCTSGLSDPPSRRNARVPGAFDDLVVRCLDAEAEQRPAAREIAEAIDGFLDGERVRSERAREADELARDGDEARAAFEALSESARKLRDEGEAALDRLPLWAPVAQKGVAWDLTERGAALSRDAARAMARAQAAFIRALGRVPDHAGARRGLASLHYRLFEQFESEGDCAAAAHELDLARSYDDGELALPLSNCGVLVVETSEPASLTVARYEEHGLRLGLGHAKDLDPRSRLFLEAGSYMIVARTADGREARSPVRVARAKTHRLYVRLPRAGEIPEGMILVPGGPFLAAANARATRMATCVLPDFAVGRFPVTFREYARFLASAEGRARIPRGPSALVEEDERGGFRLTEYAIAGGLRRYVPRERELDIPAIDVSFYDAIAYAAWLARHERRPYRLLTNLEWEKALRGADGRKFSMGDRIDASFAKTRESREEASQPEIVGSFPLDESPYGVRDLTGGVGDWVATMADGRPPPSLSEEGTPAADARQAIWRGGCWSTTSLFPHAMRYAEQVTRRMGWVGFRVGMSLEGGSSSLDVEPMQR